MSGLDSTITLNFISYTPDVPTPTPTPTPDPTVVGLLAPQTGDIASLLIILFGILATVSVALVLGRNISHNVKSVFAAFCASMLPLVLAGSCVVGINSMAAAENSANLANPQIDVYVNTQGGPVHYGEGENSNVQKFTNDTEDEVSIAEVQFKITDQASDVFVGQWTGKLNDGTLLFSGGAGDTYKLENPISLGAGESVEVTWSTDTQSEDLLDCIGKAPVSICYVVSSNTHTVTFDSNGGSEVASQEVGHGQTAAEPSVPTKDNNKFVWWASDEKLSSHFDFDTPITEDLTLYAKWEVTEEYVEEVEQEAIEEADKAKIEVEEELKELLTEEELELVKDSMDDLLDEFKKALEDAKTSEEVEQAKKKFEDDLLDIEKEALKGGSEKQEIEAEEALDDIPGLSEGDIARYKEKLQNKKDEIDKKIDDSNDFDNAKKEQEKFDPAADELLKEAIELGENKDEAREANEDISQATEDKIETFTSLLPETIQKYQKKVQDLKESTDENIDNSETSEDVENVIKEQKEDIEKILQEIQEIVKTKTEVDAKAKKDLEDNSKQIGTLPNLNDEAKAYYVLLLNQKETDFQNKLKQTDDLDEIKKISQELNDEFVKIMADAKELDDTIANYKEELKSFAKSESEKIHAKPDINQYDLVMLDQKISSLTQKGLADLSTVVNKEDAKKMFEKYKSMIADINNKITTVTLLVTGGSGHFEDKSNPGVTITTKTGLKDDVCALAIFVDQDKMRIKSVIDSEKKPYTVKQDGSFDVQLSSAFTITATLETIPVEAYAVLSTKSATNDTLTFKFDDSRSTYPADHTFDADEKVYHPGWYDYMSTSNATITNVVIEDSFKQAKPPTLEYWFEQTYELSTRKLVSIAGLKNIDTSEAISMSHTFCHLSNVNDLSGINDWNVKNVREFNYTFSECNGLTSPPNFSKWELNSSPSLYFTFDGCSSWTSFDGFKNTGNVQSQDTRGMFSGCTSMETINLMGVDFGGEGSIDAGGMFAGCEKLKNILYDKDLRQVLTEQQSLEMFADCKKLPHWNTDSGKTDKTFAYPNDGEHGFFTDPHPTVTLNPFDGGHYEDVANARINQISGDWNSTDTQVKVVIDDQSLIIDSVIDNGGNHYELTGDNCFLVDFSARYTITVTTGSATPEAYAAITSQNSTNDTLELRYDCFKSSYPIVFEDILSMNEPKWKEYTYGTIKSVKNVVVKPEFNQVTPTIMISWFKSQGNINSISGLEYINTSYVTHMSSLFYEYNGTNTIDGISNWDTSSVKNMTYMFYNAKFTTTPSISGWNVSNVEKFDCLFSGCSSLASPIDLSAWTLKKDISKNVSFFNAFSQCSYVPFINVGFTIDGTKLYTGYMFSGCSSCTDIYCNKDWRSLLDGSNEDMFAGCSSLKHWDTDSGTTDGTYAYPDDGLHGFFTSFPLTAKAVYTASDKTLTFYYDWKSHEGEGTVFEVVKDYSGQGTPFSAAKSATSVKFVPSFKNFKGITSLKDWFNNFDKLENVYNFENIDTSEVKTMHATFYRTSIKNIDFSYNNFSSLSSVTEEGIGSMFLWCPKLESVIFPESTNPSASCASAFTSCPCLTYVDTKGIKYVAGLMYGQPVFGGSTSLKTIKTSADQFASGRSLATFLGESDPTYSTWHSQLAGSDFASNTITGTKGSTGQLDTFTKVDPVDHGQPPISVLDIILDFFSVIFDVVV